MTERSSYVRSRTSERKRSSSSCSPSPSTSRSPAPSASPITRRRSRSAGSTWAIAGIISAAAGRAAHVATRGKIRDPVSEADAVDAERVELFGRQGTVVEAAREIRAVVRQPLERSFSQGQLWREASGLAAHRLVEPLLHAVRRVVEASERARWMSTRERGQELHHREAALADPEEAREVLLGAPVGQPDRSVEDERERVAELGHAGLRVPPDDRVGVEGRADTPRAAARDEHRPRLRKLTVGATQCRLRVHPAVLLHRDPSVTGGARPQVDVSGAGGDVDDRPRAEGIARVGEVEDAAVELGIVTGVDAIVEPRAPGSTRPLVEAAAATLEEDQQALGIALAQPERVLSATGTARLADAQDLDPGTEAGPGRVGAAAAGRDGEREQCGGERADHRRRSLSSQASRSSRAWSFSSCGASYQRCSFGARATLKYAFTSARGETNPASRSGTGAPPGPRARRSERDRRRSRRAR